MVFLRSISQQPTNPVLHGDRVTVRVPVLNDFEEWSKLRRESAGFLKPWEPTWPVNDLTRAAFRQRIKRYHRDLRDDIAYPFFIFSRESGELTGGLTLSNIRRGVAETASLGYWIGERHARRGFMSDAVCQVVEYAFDELMLHRIEAACIPSNAASISLLRKCGFSEEGFARHYLRINGAWRDHVLFAILSSDTPR